MENDIDFNSGGEGYFKKDPKTFKEIIISAISRCVEEGQKEMVRGGEIKEVINGEIVIRTIPNQRKLYMGCVETLNDIFRYHYDVKADEHISELYSEIEKVFDKYLAAYLHGEEDEDLKEFAKTTYSIPPSSFYYEKIMNAIEERQLGLYREIFRELIALFYRKNQFSNKRVIGAY